VAAEAEACKAHPEIGVLGDVIGIPAADFAQADGAKMVGRSSKRNGQAERCDSGQENVELASIFCREKTRQPAIGRIINAKTRLHTGDALATLAKLAQRTAQLIGLRPILGI